MSKYILLNAYYLKADAEADFLGIWGLLNDLNFRYAGCLGAKIHRPGNRGAYYEYAIWPNQETYKQSFALLPASALALKAKLKACCTRVEETIELQLLQEQYNQNSDFETSH